MSLGNLKSLGIAFIFVAALGCHKADDPVDTYGAVTPHHEGATSASAAAHHEEAESHEEVSASEGAKAKEADEAAEPATSSAVVPKPTEQATKTAPLALKAAEAQGGASEPTGNGASAPAGGTPPVEVPPPTKGVAPAKKDEKPPVGRRIVGQRCPACGATYDASAKFCGRHTKPVALVPQYEKAALGGG